MLYLVIYVSWFMIILHVVNFNIHSLEELRISDLCFCSCLVVNTFLLFLFLRCHMANKREYM